jgi:hypothetical protein
LFGVPFLSKLGTDDVILKVGGAESATLMYQVGDADLVKLGPTELPWELKPEVGLLDQSVGVTTFVGGFREKAWCEIWIGDELCDREDDGSWCRCFFKFTSWSGDINGQRSQRTSVR